MKRPDPIRFLVGMHVGVGILLMSANPLIAIFSEPAANTPPRNLVQSLPLASELGFVFFVYASLLLKRSRIIFNLGLITYLFAGFCSAIASLYALVIAMASRDLMNEPPTGPESMALGAFYVIALGGLILFVGILFFCVVAVAILFRALKHTSEQPRALFSRSASTFLIAGAMLFAFSGLIRQIATHRVISAVYERDREFAHSNSVTAIASNPQHSILATASDSHEVRMWDSTTGLPMQLIDTKAPVHTLTWAPNGKKLFAGCTAFNTPIFDGDVLVIDRELGIESRHRVPQSVQSLAVSPDGRLLAIGFTCTRSRTTDVSVEIYDTATMQRTARLGDSAVVQHVQFSSDGKQLLASRHEGISIWDFPFRSDEAERMIKCDEPSKFFYLTRDGKNIWIATNGGRLLRYTAPEFSALELRSMQSSWSPCIAITHDETRIAMGSSNEPLRLLEVANLTVAWELEPQKGLQSLEFSTDDSNLVVGTFRRVRIHDSLNGSEIRECNLLVTE